jgi:hypothetical protein
VRELGGAATSNQKVATPNREDRPERCGVGQSRTTSVTIEFHLRAATKLAR